MDDEDTHGEGEEAEGGEVQVEAVRQPPDVAGGLRPHKHEVRRDLVQWRLPQRLVRQDDQAADAPRSVE